MASKWDDETKEKIAAGVKQSWESGERKHPITKLKEEKASLQERLSQVELDVEKLKRRDARIREVFKRHRELVDKGRKQAEGNPIRSFMDDLMEAWDSED